MEHKKSLHLNEDLLSNIEIAIEGDSNEMTFYLDIINEDVVIVSDYSDLDDDMLEMIENDIDEERFIAVPTLSTQERWLQMEQFILGLDNKPLIDSLLYTIQGRGAFRRFKDALANQDLLDQWYEFTEREVRKKALEWLYSRGFITDEMVVLGIEMLEERIRKRKQHREDKINMVKGALVSCTDNVGHQDKLTIGKIYEVLDEKAQHLTIQLIDDRGKTVWVPKSHFELLHIRKS